MANFGLFAKILLAALALSSVCQVHSNEVPSASIPDRFQVDGSIKLPPTGTLPITRVLLNGGEHSAIPCADGSFSFYNVLPGTYVLEVSNPAFIFETLRLEVSQDDGRIRAFPMNRRERLPYPLQLRPAAEAQYYQVREPFSPMSFLSSPMGMFMAFGALTVFIFPKLIANMDPADLEEFKRQQAAMNPQAMMQKMQRNLEAQAQPPARTR